MKAFRIAALGVALLAGSAAIAGAQAAAPGTQQQGGPGAGGPGGGRGGIGRLITGITLTEAQQAKVTEIQAKYAPQLTAAREGAAGDRAAMFKAMQGINDKMYPEIRAVLTPEQQTIFDKNIEERKARMQQMQQGGGAGR
jgi:Spy/CpxP family protein refolding chaperone